MRPAKNVSLRNACSYGSMPKSLLFREFEKKTVSESQLMSALLQTCRFLGSVDL